MVLPLNVTAVTPVCILGSDFFIDLLKDFLVGAFFLILGMLATYYIVENALEKRRLGRVRPIAKLAIESRLWHIERALISDLYPLLPKTADELKEFVRHSDRQQDRFVWMFEQVEKLVDIYGNTIPEDIQEELTRFGQDVGDFVDTLFHLGLNYDIIDDLEEWKDFSSHCKSLSLEFEALLDKLVRKDPVSEDLQQRLQLAKDLIIRRAARNHRP